MKIVSFKIPEALDQGLEELVRRKLYPSKSAAVRTAINDLLRKELW